MEDLRVAILNDDVIPPGHGQLPFPMPKLNDGYAMLFALARERGIPMVLAHDGDYRDGRLERGWIHDGQNWTAWRDIGMLMVYDQFPSTDPRGRWMVQDMRERGIPVFNHPDVTLVVDDKLLSHANFPEMMPYTHYFHKGKDDIQETLNAFLRGVEEAGFGAVDSFVAKPQVGWGALNLHRFTQENIGDIFHIPDGEYVLQPFLETSRGIPEIGVHGRHDLRVLMENGRFATAFVRQPARHDWIANYFDPMEMVFIHDEQYLPRDILLTVQAADRKLEDYYPRLVSFDMARLDNGRVVCWEMNSRPGIAPDSSREDDIRSAMDLMNAILNCVEVQLENRWG